VTFECRIDGAAFTACTSPAGYTGLSQGQHAFDVRAKDPAGNVDASPDQRLWVVDTLPPDTTITAGPSGTVASTSATFQFNATENGARQCRLDGGAWADCSSPVSYSSLAQGAHTFEVRAYDGAGNVDPTPALASWTVDTVVPDTTIASGPSGAVASTSATFTFTATETATFQCSLDGAAFAACTSPVGYSGLAQGSHTFQVQATDGVGNQDATPASRTWSVDTTVPDTTITSAPANNSAPPATFTFTSNEAAATFECRLDGAAFTPCASPLTYSSLAKAQHTFDVRARDAAGNTDATPASHTWRSK
jgi:hypothetical protein